jgi:translation initiation factor IF-2
LSFKTLKKDQLKLVAEGFGLEVSEKATAPALLAAIIEDGNINWDDAVSLLKTEGAWTQEDVQNEEKERAAAQAEKDARPKDTLLKMKRANRRYDIRGYTFTQEHPYALVTAEDAEAITDGDPEGFAYATPKEAQQFYS